MKKLNRVCPICGNSTGEELLPIKMSLSPEIHLPPEYDVVSCERCGFAFADVAATQNDYDEYYKNLNMYSDEATRYELYNPLNEKRVEFISKYIPRNAKILDVGCGSGLFLKKLKDTGFTNLTGMDPSKDSCAVLEENGITSLCASIFDTDSIEKSASKMTGGGYDMVSLTEVFEHIYDLNFVFDNIKKIMTEKSFLFVDVPAIEAIAERPTPIADNFNVEHINYFTYNSIINLFTSNGFELASNKSDNFYQKGKVSEALYTRCHAVLFKFSPKNEQRKIEYDYIGKETIKPYAASQLKIQNDKLSRLGEWLQSRKNIVVWGSGNYAMQLLKKNPAILNKTEFFVDNNKTKIDHEFLGKVVKIPKTLQENKYPVLILSMNYAKDIVCECENMGVEYFVY